MTTKALILVDIQNDFMPGGALAVPEGDQVIPIANALAANSPVLVATQDYHPVGHESFASQHEGKSPGEVIDLHGLEQVLWPDHCVEGTPGADFAPGLELGQARVFQKGTNKSIDSYSGFFDNGQRKATGLEAFLKERDIVELYVLGVATDYCVKYTALDAARLGFDTYLVLDACRGVELHDGDIERAIEEMKAAGVSIVRSDAALASLQS